MSAIYGRKSSSLTHLDVSPIIPPTCSKDSTISTTMKWEARCRAATTLPKSARTATPSMNAQKLNRSTTLSSAPNAGQQRSQLAPSAIQKFGDTITYRGSYQFRSILRPYSAMNAARPILGQRLDWKRRVNLRENRKGWMTTKKAFSPGASTT